MTGRLVGWYRRLSDRRGRLRFELVGEMPAALRTIEMLAVRDISRKGALVESTAPLPVESVHTLRFVAQAMTGDVTARVRHIIRADRADGSEWYRIGFEFLDLPPAIGEEIGRLAGGNLSSSES